MSKSLKNFITIDVSCLRWIQDYVPMFVCRKSCRSIQHVNFDWHS
jgi:hypothetical protein